MAEYIERDRLVTFLRERKVKETGAFTKGTNKGLNISISALCNRELIPAADVAPVVHGRWIPVGKLSIGGLNGYTQFYKCSNCEYLDFIESRYCSGCGAKMNWRSDDGEC